MSDHATRELRRRALEGDELALERLRAAWLRENQVVEEAEDEEPGRPTVHVAPTATGTIRGLARKSPLFDREVLSPESTHARIFGNLREANDGTTKSAVDSKFGPWHPGASHAYDFHLYRVLMLVDAGTDPRDAEVVWNRGRLVLVMAQCPQIEWPCRLIMPPPRPLPTGAVEVARIVYPLNVGADVTVAGRPIRLRPLEQGGFNLDCSAPRRGPVWFMVILQGISVRGMSA